MTLGATDTIFYEPRGGDIDCQHLCYLLKFNTISCQFQYEAPSALSHLRIKQTKQAHMLNSSSDRHLYDTSLFGYRGDQARMSTPTVQQNIQRTSIVLQQHVQRTLAVLQLEQLVSDIQELTQLASTAYIAATQQLATKDFQRLSTQMFQQLMQLAPQHPLRSTIAHQLQQLATASDAEPATTTGQRAGSVSATKQFADFDSIAGSCSASQRFMQLASQQQLARFASHATELDDTAAMMAAEFPTCLILHAQPPEAADMILRAQLPETADIFMHALLLHAADMIVRAQLAAWGCRCDSSHAAT